MNDSIEKTDNSNEISQEKTPEISQGRLKCPECNCFIDSDLIEDKSQYVCPNCFYEFDSNPPILKSDKVSLFLIGLLCWWFGPFGLIFIGFRPFITGFVFTIFWFMGYFFGTNRSTSFQKYDLLIFIILIYQVIIVCLGVYFAEKYNSNTIMKMKHLPH